MDKLCRKVFRRKSRSQRDDGAREDAEAETSLQERSVDPQLDAGDNKAEDDKSVTVAACKKISSKCKDKAKHGRPLDPYVPPYVARQTRRQSPPRCTCGCGCNESSRADRWRPDLKKLSKCSGILATVLTTAAAAASDTDSDEEKEARYMQYRGDRQWHEFQLANGTETEGYRLSPR